MRENFLNMTIKEKPLEEDMFSLPITQLKTKGITQCFFSPQGQASIRSHHVNFDEPTHWGGICGVSAKKEKWSPSAVSMCTPSHPTSSASSPHPHKTSSGSGEKWKQPPVEQ